MKAVAEEVWSVLRSHWALVAFTVLFGLGFGLWCWLYVSHLLDPESVRRRAWLSWLPPCLVGAGLAVSLLHLASPLSFLRALTNWGTSWLSREVWFAGLFLAGTVLYALGSAGWPAGRSRRYMGVTGAVSLLLGAAATLSTGLVYTRALGMPGWTQPATITMFPVMGLALGAALYTALHLPAAPRGGSAGAGAMPGVALGLALAAAFQVWLSFFAPSSMQAAVPAWQSAIVWGCLALAAGALVAVVAGQRRPRPAPLAAAYGWAAFFLLAVAVTWSRVWFYTLVQHL